MSTPAGRPDTPLSDKQVRQFAEQIRRLVREEPSFTAEYWVHVTGFRGAQAERVLAAVEAGAES
jgi:hypothetical protein